MDPWRLAERVAAMPGYASMADRDHGATDGLHLEDAGGEEERGDEGE